MRLLYIKYPPLTWSNSQLTFSYPVRRQPELGASTPEAALDTVGDGDHDDAVSSREVNLISRYHGQRRKIRPRNAEER
ncbi:MAG: hypothetical protein ABJ059_22480 [Hyphomicrobiales bacterium]